VSLVPVSDDFASIIKLIEASRAKVYAAVNTALIDLYWQVGKTLSRKIAAAEWGEGVVTQLAQHIAATYPGLRGFTRANLYRMRQFYETYHDNEIVSALLRQLPWTHHVIIMSQSQRPEEREFYLRQATSEKWSSRELERQFKSALFERNVRHPPKVLPVVRQLFPVVEYALSRSLSPALVAQYQTQLPNKDLLRAKLHEFYRLSTRQGDDL